MTAQITIPLHERQAQLNREIDACVAEGYVLECHKTTFAYAVLTHPERRTISIEIRDDGRVGRFPR